MQALQKEATGQGIVWLTMISSAPGTQGHVTAGAGDELTKTRKAAPTAVLLDPTGVVGQGVRRHQHAAHVRDRQGGHARLRRRHRRPARPPGRATCRARRTTCARRSPSVAAGQPVKTPVTRAYGCTVKYAVIAVSRLTRRRLLHGAAVAARALGRAAPGARAGRATPARRGHGRRRHWPSSAPSTRARGTRGLRARRRRAAELALRPARPRGRALQGHARAGARRGARADEGVLSAVGYAQGRQRHPARRGPAPDRDASGSRATPRTTPSPSSARRAPRRAVGLARRGPSPLAQLHARARPARGGDAGLPGREPRRGAVGAARRASARSRHEQDLGLALARGA